MSEALISSIAQAGGFDPTHTGVSLRPALAHQSNRLYDIWVGQRHFIAKEFLQPDEIVESPEREFRALRLLAPLDIAPQPVFFQPALGPVVIYAFMEGVMWDRQLPSLNSLALLAESWLTLSEIPTENLWKSRGADRSFGAIEAHFRTIFQEYAGWTSSAFLPGQAAAELCLAVLDSRRDAIRALADMPPVYCFCPADARFANVIQRPDGRLGLIDWEDSGLRDPARSLAELLTHPNQEDLLTPAAKDALLQPYLTGRASVDSTLAERTHIYLGLYPIFWLSILIQHGLQLAQTGQLAGWASNGIPAKERLQRYAARALAWPNQMPEQRYEVFTALEFFPEE